MLTFILQHYFTEKCLSGKLHAYTNPVYIPDLQHVYNMQLLPLFVVKSIVLPFNE